MRGQRWRASWGREEGGLGENTARRKGPRARTLVEPMCPGAEGSPEATAEAWPQAAREGSSGKRPRQGLRFHPRSRHKTRTDVQERGGRDLPVKPGQAGRSTDTAQRRSVHTVLPVPVSKNHQGRCRRRQGA